MSEAAAETATADAAAPSEQETSSYWPDETVDMLAALAVVTCLVAGLLWFVLNG
jgi:hypothetical protein